MRTYWAKRLRFLFIFRERNYVSRRLFSKFTGSDSVVDPFKKKSHVPFRLESECRNSNRICITILGNGGIGQPRCVGLFTEFKGYLFNCGEGVGRYCAEYDVNTYLIKHIFATQRKWENICGLADLYVTNKTKGVYNMSLYGPPGIEHFLSMISAKELDTKVVKKEGGYIDHTVNIDYISISSKRKNLPLSKYDKKKHNRGEPEVYCYVCKIFERKGDLLMEKCIEYGVPIGSDLLKLKNWENIVLPSGKTLCAEDVHDLTYPERIILIVDCPSESFLEPLVNEKKFEQYQAAHQSSAELSVFHFTPVQIFKSGKYQNWINRFPQNTEHFVLNSDNSIVGGIVIHQTHKYFNLLHPEIFSELRDQEFESEQDSFIKNNLIFPPPMMQIQLRPRKEFSWSNVVKDRENLNIAVDGSDIVMDSSKFYENLNNLKAFLHKKSLSNVEKGIYPEVLFLGTSSASPTAYRNVSAILLNISFNNSILLDCGEGTVTQFVRYFGSDFYSALQKISCIFISHKHVDHYVGLFELISQRIKAFEKANVPYKPVAVILPFEIEHIFMKFCEVFENLLPAVQIFSCRYLGSKRNKLKKYIGNIELLTVPVKHCADAWGIVIESNSEWKYVYSADTAPCQTLIDAGKDCTVLIHEASIEDGLLTEALSKQHSTPSQVIDIAEKMNAQHTILTHFSKRYLGFPVLPEGCSKVPACAFDFMKVRKCDLPLLPLFTPVIKCLFEEQLKDHTERFTWMLDFEKSFYNMKKS